MLKNLCRVTGVPYVYTGADAVNWIEYNFPEYLNIYRFILGDFPDPNKNFVLLNSSAFICLVLDPEKAQLYVIQDKHIEMVF